MKTAVGQFKSSLRCFCRVHCPLWRKPKGDRRKCAGVRTAFRFLCSFVLWHESTGLSLERVQWVVFSSLDESFVSLLACYKKKKKTYLIRYNCHWVSSFQNCMTVFFFVCFVLNNCNCFCPIMKVSGVQNNIGPHRVSLYRGKFCMFFEAF